MITKYEVWYDDDDNGRSYLKGRYDSYEEAQEVVNYLQRISCNSWIETVYDKFDENTND